MTNVIVSGCNGRMGKAIVKSIDKRDDCYVIAGIDVMQGEDSSFPVYDDFSKVVEPADVIIDFSHPSVLPGLLTFTKKKNIPAVICTTGYNDDEVAQINEAAKEVALFYSGNMSLGINLLIELSKKATAVFGSGVDIEIIEKHHNQKLDAPSGTALMIADAIADTMESEPQYVYDRHSYRKKREKKEIGLHAVRAGTIIGEHEVIFAGHDEVLSIKHEALSREVFVTGSVNAAIFLKTKAPGLYNMGHMLAEA